MDLGGTHFRVTKRNMTMKIIFTVHPEYLGAAHTVSLRGAACLDKRFLRHVAECEEVTGLTCVS